MEVAEHVPKRHETTLLANLDNHNTRGVVLSWSWSKGGIGHVNPLWKSRVTSIMRTWNYTEDHVATRALQEAATYSWFKEGKQHSTAGGGVRVWRRKTELGGEARGSQ
jgi:hypothetical protein